MSKPVKLYPKRKEKFKISPTLKRKLLVFGFVVIVTGSVSSGFGEQALDLQDLVNGEFPCFRVTNFDYCITNPSHETIAQLKSNPLEIKSVFPVLNYEVVINSKNGGSHKMNLTLSDEMDNADSGYFNDATKLRGDFDEDGFMIDEIAAKKIGVDVGDEIFYTFNNKEYKDVVDGIFSSVIYHNLNGGVALTGISKEEILSMGNPTYSYAFVETKDKQDLQNHFKPIMPGEKIDAKGDMFSLVMREINTRLNIYRGVGIGLSISLASILAVACNYYFMQDKRFKYMDDKYIKHERMENLKLSIAAPLLSGVITGSVIGIAGSIIGTSFATIGGVLATFVAPFAVPLAAGVISALMVKTEKDKTKKSGSNPLKTNLANKQDNKVKENVTNKDQTKAETKPTSSQENKGNVVTPKPKKIHYKLNDLLFHDFIDKNDKDDDSDDGDESKIKETIEENNKFDSN